MFKRIAKTAFVILPLWAAWPPNASASMLKFKDSSVHAPKLGRLDLYHSDDEGYSVFMKGEYKSIPKYSVSPELRSLTSSQLNRYQDAAFLTVNEQSDGELSLKSHVRGEAGGLGGAQIGFFAGKFLTTFVGHGAISVATAVVTVVCPPAAVPFDIAARAALTPVIETASLYVGLAGGIAGGAVTGPA